MTDSALDLDALAELCEVVFRHAPTPWHTRRVTGRPGRAVFDQGGHIVCKVPPRRNTPEAIAERGLTQKTAELLATLPQALATIRARDEEVRQLRAGYNIVEKRCIDRGHKLAAAQARVAALEAENGRLREALTPSTATKQAYIGEFTYSCQGVDERGDACTERRTVPWTSIKEIMAAILARALGQPADAEE